MIIAVVVNEFPKLSETFIYNKVLQLAKRGHSIYIYCTSKNDQLFSQIFTDTNNIKLVSINEKAIIKYLLFHPYHLIKTSKADYANLQFLAAVNRVKPDIVHVEFSGIGVRYLEILDKIKAKKVVSCRGTAEKITLLATEERKQKIKQLFKLADAVHCVSNDMMQTVIPYCTEPQKIFINHAAVDVDKFKSAGNNASSGSLIILTAGRLTFQKGYYTGLLAIKKLSELHTDFQWLIAGDGPQQEELSFHIHQMQLNPYVVLLGAKTNNELIELYNQSHIFFFPSVAEGLGNVALEAMSMQLPVVATRSGGIQEVIEHGIDGLLSDVYDMNSLTNNLLLLLNNSEIRLSIGKAARQKVIGNFNISQQTDKFEAAYNSLLK